MQRSAIKRSDNPTGGSLSYVCHLCPITFRCMKQFSGHVHAHVTLGAGSSAKTCLPVNLSQSASSEHVKIYHKCRSCRRVFREPVALTDHYVSAHNFAGAFAPSWSGIYFEQRRIFQRDHCYFTAQSNAGKSEVGRSGSDTKVLPNDEYSKELTSDVVLYSCPSCTQRYTSRDGLAQHTKAHALEANSSVGRKKRVPAKPGLLSAPVQNYTLPATKPCYVSLYRLDANRYKCKVCNGMFTTGVALKRHALLHRIYSTQRVVIRESKATRLRTRALAAEEVSSSARGRLKTTRDAELTSAFSPEDDLDCQLMETQDAGVADEPRDTSLNLLVERDRDETRQKPTELRTTDRELSSLTLEVETDRSNLATFPPNLQGGDNRSTLRDNFFCRTEDVPKLVPYVRRNRPKDCVFECGRCNYKSTSFAFVKRHLLARHKEPPCPPDQTSVQLVDVVDLRGGQRTPPRAASNLGSLPLRGRPVPKASNQPQSRTTLPDPNSLRNLFGYAASALGSEENRAGLQTRSSAENGVGGVQPTAGSLANPATNTEESDVTAPDISQTERSGKNEYNEECAARSRIAATDGGRQPPNVTASSSTIGLHRCMLCDQTYTLRDSLVLHVKTHKDAIDSAMRLLTLTLGDRLIAPLLLGNGADQLQSTTRVQASSPSVVLGNGEVIDGGSVPQPGDCALRLSLNIGVEPILNLPRVKEEPGTFSRSCDLFSLAEGTDFHIFPQDGVLGHLETVSTEVCGI